MGKTKAEVYIGNTIAFDTKSSQVKVTIVKRTKIILKQLSVNRSQKHCWRYQQVCDAIEQTYVNSNY